MNLLERERSLADLGAWLTAAARDAGCIALVSGEAGIGKSVLVHEFSKQQGDARVLWGACDALFTPRPLAPLHDIARQSQGALLAAIESGVSRDAIFTAALDELERTHTLVVFEDMHWADEATLDLLKYLGGRIQRTRSMLAVTYRDDEVGPQHPLRFVIGELPRSSTHRISLLPLSETAVCNLASQAGRSPKDLYHVTGGNPLFVTEVLAAVADIVPPTVRDAVLARAARLSASARAIAEFVSVVPGKTEVWLLQHAAHPDEKDIEDCLRIGMVRFEDGSLAYRHELVRRAFQDCLSPPRLQSLHAKVLAVLATRADSPAARLAHHASGARDAEQVLRYAPAAAAQAASVGGHREAASHYELALSYAAHLPAEQRAGLQELLSQECYLTGRHERAIEVQRAALQIWRSAGSSIKQGRALEWLSRMCWFAGRLEEAMDYVVDAIAVLEALPPGPELATAYRGKADLDMEAHENESAIDWACRAITLAESLGDTGILSHALNARGTARLIRGDVDGWTDLTRSLQLALVGGVDERIASSYINLAAMAVSCRQYEQAQLYLERGLAHCKERDLDSFWLYLIAYRARMRFEQGEWNGAGNDADTVLRHPGATPITRIPALRTLAHLRIRRGDPDAHSPLAQAQALGGSAPQLQRMGTLAAVRAEAAWLAGDLQGVAREVQPVYQLLQQRPDPRMKGELAAWLWRVGSLDQHPADIAEAYALEIAGKWRDAAAVWEKLGCPYEQACMLAWYGAETEQRQALKILEQLGAAPAAQALRKKMREHGVRSIPRGSRTSTRANPLGLTGREAEILALLSQGLRNAVIAKRLLLSTKTIENHVSSILAKLGVPSRAQAIAIARQQPGERG
jgi:DNA-binding CsgD family transcriptional regulator